MDSKSPAPAKPSRSSPLLSDRKIKHGCVFKYVLLLGNEWTIGSPVRRTLKLIALPG